MPKITCMPPTAYNRTIAMIRDYPRLLCELEQKKRDVLYLKASNIDGMPKGDGDSGLDDAIAELDAMEREIEKMQAAMDIIPADMRDGILHNIWYNTGYPRNEYGLLVPCMRTWKEEKQKFIITFARMMRIYPYRPHKDK